MKKEVRFYSSFTKEQESILEFAKKLTLTFLEFGQYDNRFTVVNVRLPKEDLKIDLTENNSYLALAEAILVYNQKDIRKFDKIKDATIDYSRPYGFSLGFHINNQTDKNIMSFSTFFGGIEDVLNYRMNEMPIKKIENFTQDWYLHLFMALTKYLPLSYAEARPRDMEFLNNTKPKYKYPLGFITYFNKELKSLIPNNIKGLEYRELENGLLVKLAENSIPQSDEDFEKKVNTLYSIMESIGDINPDFRV